MEITRDNTMLMTSPTSSHLMLKVGLSPSIKFFFCFGESNLEMMKNAFYFILKALFVHKIFKFLC